MSNDMGSMERMFRHNGTINRLFLEKLSPDELQLTDGQGGHSIFWLLAHLAHTRSWSAKSISTDPVFHVAPAMRRDEDGTVHLLVNTAQDIQNILVTGDETLLSAVRSAAQDTSREGLYRDPTMILARTFNHDAHHRGQIMSILRLHDIKHPELNRALFTSWADL